MTGPNDREGQLRALATQVLGSDASEIERSADLTAALGVDSLSGLRFLAAVEKAYDVRFPDEQLSEIRSLERVLSHLETSLGPEGETA